MVELLYQFQVEVQSGQLKNIQATVNQVWFPTWFSVEIKLQINPVEIDFTSKLKKLYSK